MMQMIPTRRAALAMMGLGLAVLALQGCCGNCGIEKTPVPEKRADFVGSWEGDEGTSLTITADGSGSFEQKSGAASKSVSGGAVTFQGDTMKIGLFGIEETFTIDKAPYDKDGKTMMKLSGESFEKQ